MAIHPKQSTWRLVNAPATIGNDFNGAIVAPMLPLFFISLIIKVPELNIVPMVCIIAELYRIKRKLPTLLDVPKYIFFKYVTGHYWYGFRRAAYASLTSFLAALFIVIPSPAEADFNVIRPAADRQSPTGANRIKGANPGTAQSIPETRAMPQGGVFVENSTPIAGAGPSVELGVLLKQLVPATYTIQFNSVEISSISINWKSANWTADQILGNLALRYGIMFETMHGSSVIAVDWVDKNKCSDNKQKLFKRLCGSMEGYFVE